jgi:hypothetical protein
MTVGTDGRFSAALMPGTYSLVGRSPLYNGGMAYDCQALQVAVVTADRTTSTNVFCQER